jgi:hypothetical protein
MWSIGIYVGDSPFQLTSASNLENPVLSQQDVTDVPASFLADPFMIQVNEVWYMFLEVMNPKTDKGEIGLATSLNGLTWDYQQIVLDEPFHLSYPYVFQWNDAYYMVPETLQPGAIRLYRASSFPKRWVYVKEMIKGEFADTSICYFAGKWWLFTCPTPHQHNMLRLFFAEDLMGLWTEHPKSPIVQDNIHNARPAGRVVVFNERVIRYAQDCYPKYGTQVRAFEISELTPTTYIETENSYSPILTATGSGWNGKGMHHIDPHFVKGQWIACVDGHFLA